MRGNTRSFQHSSSHAEDNVVGKDRAFRAMKDPNRHKPRRTIDSSTSSLYQHFLHRYTWDHRDDPALEPHNAYAYMMKPPAEDTCCAPNNYLTRHVYNCINKVRSPMHAVVFSPDGKRVTTGDASGEITLWFGNNFKFDNIADDRNKSGILSMEYSHNGDYFICGYETGQVKCWSRHIAKMFDFDAHESAVTSLSFAPTDQKFVTGSGDATVAVWDFETETADFRLSGHKSNVLSVSWHPSSALVASGSEDKSVRLWDPRAGRELRVLSSHKGDVTRVAWNGNGWWLLSASRDSTISIFDIRRMGELSSVQTEHGGVSTAAWHPLVERLFVSGSRDGAVQFWSEGFQYPQAEIPQAHGGPVNGIAFHPGGSLMATVSQDCATKLWARSRPGDTAAQYAYQGLQPRSVNMNVVPLPRELQGLLGSDVNRADHEMAVVAGSAFAGLSFDPKDEDNRGRRTNINRPPPPPSYVCNICNQPGHWIDDCEEKKKSQGSRAAGKVPSEGYVCKQCGIPGHWRADCPNANANKERNAEGKLVSKKPGPGYVCFACGGTDHWKNDCPMKDPQNLRMINNPTHNFSDRVDYDMDPGRQFKRSRY